MTALNDYIKLLGTRCIVSSLVDNDVVAYLNNNGYGQSIVVGIVKKVGQQAYIARKDSSIFSGYINVDFGPVRILGHRTGVSVEDSLADDSLEAELLDIVQAAGERAGIGEREFAVHFIDSLTLDAMHASGDYQLNSVLAMTGLGVLITAANYRIDYDALDEELVGMLVRAGIQ